MDIKSTDLVSFFESSLRNISDTTFIESGVVLQVGDGICTVYGLKNVVYGELVNFQGGNQGIVLQLDEFEVSVFILYSTIVVSEREVVTRTGSAYTIGVGEKLLGRVINARGEIIDGGAAVDYKEYRPIESAIPGIIARSPINSSLETGILAIDALVPIGRGQRELIIGNRSTGKTEIALDTILHQKDKDVLCVYVSIGQRQAGLARIVNLLEERDALKYTVIVAAAAGQAVLNQYLAPYVGCTIAEYFRDLKRDVLIVYDDLSSHAVAYREMSLLLRRAPGREAYPGDVFYLHARLLERAGKLLSGGSITALPIVQIQSDDITAYVPTNLISITDGQIFLDTHLFNQGIRPAVNGELSVSRVGGAAQTKAIKKMTRALRLELAQYKELLDFAQFGTELDEISRARLNRGERVTELLKQPQYTTYSFVDQALMLFLLRFNFLDEIALPNVRHFAIQYISFVHAIYPELIKEIFQSEDVTDEQQKTLSNIVAEFKEIYVQPVV